MYRTMTDDFTDFDGIGPTLNDRLHDNGYETYEDLAAADYDELQEINGVTEDRALSAIAAAEEVANLVVADEGSENGTDESDGEDDEDHSEEDESPESDSEDDEADEESSDDELDEYSVDLDLSPREREVTISALLDSYTTLQSRNRSRALAADRVLGKLRDGDDLSLTENELNALYAALHQRSEEYKGNNHVDLMNVSKGVEASVNDVRNDVLF